MDWLESDVGVTIHDGMFDLRPNRVGSGHLRCDLWARFGKANTKKAVMTKN